MKILFKRKNIPILAMAVFSACKPSPELEVSSSPDIVINDGRYDSRISVHQDERILPIDATNVIIKNGRTQTETPEDQNYVLVLRAEVDPPQWEDNILQASHVAVSNGYAYITYNTQGEIFQGGLDIINVENPLNASLAAQAIFPKAEFSSVDIDENTIYLAGARIDVDSLNSPGVLEIMQYENELLPDRKTIDLPGYVGTDVKVDDHYIYVTHGSNGGLSIYNKTNLELIQSIPMDDARSLLLTDEEIMVMQGSPARINIIQKNTWQLVKTYSTDGANEAGAKSVFSKSDDHYFVPAGKDGLKLLSQIDGSVTQHISMPEIADIDAGDIACNGVSYANNKVFAANGAAGLYVLHEVDDEFQLFGTVQFSASTNYVMSQDNLLFVATGTGGLKIIEIVHYDPEAGDYINTGDWDEYGRPDYLCDIETALNSEIESRIKDLFIAGNDLTIRQPNWFSETVLTDVEFLEDTDLEITAVSETTHHHNTIGYYTYPTNQKPNSPSDILDLTVLFPNATVTKSGSHLMKGDKLCIPNFTAGDNLGFFLNFKGFVEGEVTTGYRTHYSSQWLNKFRPIKQQNVILAVPEYKTLILGFEDVQRPYHDQDFDDGIFLIKFSNPNAVNWSAFPELP